MEELNWKYWYTDVDKDQNQYTYEECNRIGPVDAKYVKSSNKDFNGNPFIEALPRPRDGKELINAYTCPIPAVDMGELDDMTINEQNFASRFAPFVNERNVMGIMDELSEAQLHIEQNVNAKMVFFDFSLKMIVLLKQ